MKVAGGSGSQELPTNAQPDSRRVHGTPPPRPDWDALLPGGHGVHGVHFYEDDAFLLDGLSRFIGSAIAAGDSALVVASQAHGNSLYQRLKQGGLDLAVAAEQGRFMLLDASEALDKFMVDGHPDASRFEEVIGVLVERLANRNGEPQRLAVFGEMVALLWAEGRKEAAIELEQLWNRLAEKHTFQLHCAYPLALFANAGDSEGVERICAEHTQVVPTEKYSTLDTDAARMSAIAVLQQKAQALRESEEFLRAIIETTPECVKLVAADGKLLHMNPTGLKMVGADSAEMVAGKSIYLLIAPEDREKFREFHERICRGGRGTLEFDIIGFKGVRRHMETQAAPLRQSDGTLVQLAVTRDITERKKAERALQESEQLLRVVTDASPIMVWMSGTDKLCYYFNKSWLDFVGRTLEQESGNGWAENVHPDDFDRCLNIYVSSFDARRPFAMEYRLRHHSGEYRWILDRGVPRYAPDGTFEGYVGGCLDIHDQKEAREELRRNRDRLQTALMASQRLAAIVESSSDAIIGKDLNGIVTSWNKTAELLFGYKAEEIVGKPITTVIPPELHRDEDMILAKIRRGERIEHFETVRVTKSGERIDVSLTISPVTDANGNVVGAAKIARNITENKKIERALRITEKLAAAGRLAATVAHEINNPLEAVTNLVYLAKRDLPDTTRASAHLKLAQRELERVAHIARQTLGFYRDTSSPVRFGLTRMMDDLLSLYEKRFEARNIKVLRQYSGPIEMKALAGEVRQALSNIITNAIDAMPEGGQLVVRIAHAHAYGSSRKPGVRITILDTGSGIAPQHRKSLFQPFFTTKEDVGTGLGLWITRNIVEKHLGSIKVRSRAGGHRNGTAFSIFLPQEATENAGPGVAETAHGTGTAVA
ncbi:MAG TPA: PAS domain S-box protein [Candidatus Angelobacter sp.]|nr:PAS domain S-box protein [Candidatus Angelobacter sp.]